MSTDLPACVGLLGLLAQASTLNRLPRTGWLLFFSLKAGLMPRSNHLHLETLTTKRNCFFSS